MKHLFTSIILGISIAAATAQNTPVTPPLTPLQQQPATDVKVLEVKFKQSFEVNRQKAEEIAKVTGVKLRMVSPVTGQISEFAGFAPNGQMLFNQTQNIGAGRTISTNKVWPGGSAGTALTGSGMNNRLGEWDGGAVLTSHQELNGRVTQVDGASQLSDHATHVAGTMIAAGVDANARGMAYQATLRAYDWNNDESEMVTAAGAGMLVSNHSYGTICGWTLNEGEGRWEWWGDASISAVEDYKFGFYDQQAADWDEIAYNNPNYLICKSAGNDRGDQATSQFPKYVRDVNFNWVPSSATRNADGNANGFDCIASSAVSKNILTVGAVNKIGSSNNNSGWTQVSDVVMSSFSGWGPTDDGRIKPDVVACGVNLYSSFSGSNTDYSSISGTSMASPNTTGSLLLVQQHYNNLRAKFMRASTLKALIIHTADEAGNAGPDYTYGWGLVNTAKAVKLITDSNYNQIQERTLANTATYTQGVSSDGTAPLRVTICWTDVQGTPTGTALDPTNKMLVNDLDIRIKRNSDNVEFSPFILNPAVPGSAATTGDNTRDNVEQIVIASPQPGAYTITVKHKGTLFNSQAQSYSMIIGGIVGNPAASFSANVQSICAGQTVQFTDNSGGNPTSRVWYFPGGTPSTATTTTVNVTYANPGSYPVALKVTNPLGSDSTYISGYIKSGGSPLPFTETFETNSSTLNAWLVDNPDMDSTWRLANTGGTLPGNASACIPFYNMNNLATRDGLISPPLDFKGYQNVSLTFKHAYSGYPSNATDSLVIWVSTNCGNTWTRVKSIGEDGSENFITEPASFNEFLPLTSNEWCSSNCITVNLSAFDGMSNVKIKFEGYNSFGNNLYIDNINVTGSALKPVTKFGVPSSTVCAGTPVYFTDSTDNNPSTWQWTFTGAVATTSTQQHPSVTYNTPGTYTVKLKTVNSGGADSLIKTNYITVISSPNKPNISSAGPGFCIGDSVMLSTDSVNNGYQWYHNNIAIGGAAASSYYALVSGNYKVNIMGVNGCGTSSNVVNILSGAKPDMPVITNNLGGGTSLCAGGTAILTSTANSGNQWFKNNAKVNGATNKTFSTQDSGTYTVISTVSGCASDQAADHALQLRTKPVTSAIGGSANVEYNSVEAYSVTNTVGSTYQWFITGGVLTTGGGTSSITITWGASGTGSISVKETAANGCSGDNKTLAVTLTPPTGLEQLSFFSGVSVFPNPVSDQLTIAFNGNTQKEVTVKMINILGQTMSEEKLTSVNSGYQHKMDVSKLNPGIYFVEVSNAEGSRVIKITRK
jgi:PKD repeat protein